MSGIEIRFVGPLGVPAVDADEADRGLIHAVGCDAMEASCGQFRYRLLPTLKRWGWAPRDVELCGACLNLIPATCHALPPLGETENRPTWIYGRGINSVSIARDGVSYRAAGSAFFRGRHLSWDEVQDFAPETYTLEGIGRDKGAGRRWGHTVAWRISLRRRSGRPIRIPAWLPDAYSETQALAFAAAMNTALALPRGQ